jgi:hypothetical protein
MNTVGSNYPFVSSNQRRTNRILLLFGDDGKTHQNQHIIILSAATRLVDLDCWRRRAGCSVEINQIRSSSSNEENVLIMSCSRRRRIRRRSDGEGWTEKGTSENRCFRLSWSNESTWFSLQNEGLTMLCCVFSST